MANLPERDAARLPDSAAPAPGFPGPRSYWLGVAAIALAACAALVLASTWAIGLSPDSVNYLRGAERLARGEGLFSQNVHWPPGYPALLAVGPLVGADALVWARGLHVGLFAANVLLMAVALAAGSPRARLVALLGLGFFACGTLSVHVMAWSEIPFVALQLAAALTLVRSLTEGGRPLWLWTSAALGALSVLMRFAGFPLAAVGAGMLWFFGTGSLGARLARAAAWAGAVCAPAAAYMLGNRWVHGQALDRTPLAPGLSVEKIALAVPSALAWFDAEHTWLAGALGAGSVALLAGYAWTRRVFRGEDRAHLLVCFALLYLVAYLLFVLAYMTFLDRYISLNERVLFPAQVFFLLALLTACVRLSESTTWSRGAVAALVLLVVLLPTSFDAAQREVRELSQNGLGQLDRASRSLPIWERLRGADPPTLYSNGPDLVYLHLRRTARMLPRHSRPEAGAPNRAYAEQMERLVAEVERGDAVVVVFNRFLWRSYLPGPRQLEEGFGLQSAYRGPDGVLYTTVRRGARHRAGARAGS